MTSVPRTTVRLSSDHAKRLDAAAKLRGKPRSEIIRTALDAFLVDDAAARTSAYRLAQTTEFMQIVADLIVSRDMPEKRDAIMTTVALRLEQFHGRR